MNRDILGIVVANLVGNARRTTLLAAPILVGAIVLQGVFIGALEGGNQIRERFEERGGDMVLVRSLDSASAADDLSQLYEAGRAVSQRSGPQIAQAGAMVTVLQPELSLSEADTESSSVELRASLVLTESATLDAGAVTVSAGRLFGPVDEAGFADVALVGSTMARHYGLDTAALANAPTVRVFGRPVRVVGVLEPSGRLPELNSAIVLPVEAPVVDSIRRHPDRDPALESASIVVRASSITTVEEAADEVMAILRSQAALPAMQADFDGGLLRSYRDGLASLLLSLALAGGLGAVASLASCTYLQTSSIKLRRAELGLRLALGTPPKAVQAILWIESMILGLVCWAVTAAGALILVGRGASSLDVASLILGSFVLTLVVATVLPARSVQQLMEQSPASLLGG